MKELVEFQLRELFVRSLRLHVKPSDLPQDNLLTRLAINSISTMEILINIETKFDIEFDLDRMPTDILDSLDGLAQYIVAKQTPL